MTKKNSLVYSLVLLVAFSLFAANLSNAQQLHSFGPSPVTDQVVQGNDLSDNISNANSRGFVYISGTSSHQLNKQFMGNVAVTAVGSPFTGAGWIGAIARNTVTGTLYTCNQASPFNIWSIDTTTGVLTQVVASCTGLPQTNFTGFVYDHTTGNYYGLSSSLSASQIFTVNMSTGVCTPIGSASAVCAGGITLACAPNGTLFVVDIVADNLYKVNKTTGVFTLVGPLGFAANYGQDGAFDLSDGVLYLASAGPGNILRTCDTTTGSATTVIGTYAGQPSCLAIVPFQTGPVVPTGTWTEQSSGLTTVLYSVSAVDDNVAWVCGASGKVLRTTNKGANWVNVSGSLPTAANLYNIFAWDANLAIITGVTGSNTSIYQTSNGGTTWTTVNTHAGFGDNLWMTSASNGYFIGDPIAGNWDLLSSTNAGMNWGTWSTLATTNTSGTYNNGAFFNGTNVYFESVGQSHILFSSNMGVNWVQQTITLSELTAIWFNTASEGLAGGSSTSPGLLKSTNGGTNWTALTSPYPTNSISGIVGAASTYWVSQQGTGISITTNSGTSFTTAYTAPAGNFYHMTKSRAGATIWAVRSNGGISRYGQPILGVTPISSEVPASFSLSQNYPNPFNPTTKINFALPKSGLVTLKVYDVLGKEVSTLVNEVKNAGTYSFEFNASSLTSGVYFYKLEANGFSDVKKMLLVK